MGVRVLLDPPLREITGTWRKASKSCDTKTLNVTGFVFTGFDLSLGKTEQQGTTV